MSDTTNVADIVIEPSITQMIFTVEYIENGVVLETSDVHAVNEVSALNVDVSTNTIDVTGPHDVISTTTNNYFIGTMLFGTKTSGINVGSHGDMSFDDDYIYICTQTGTAETAIWKKTPLLRT